MVQVLEAAGSPSSPGSSRLSRSSAGSPATAGDLADAVEVAASFVGAYEPGRYSGEDSEHLAGLFNRLQRVAEAGLTLAAGRVAEANRHTATGHRTPAEWLAGTTGDSVGNAASTLELAEQLQAQPGVDEALRAGALPAHRAKLIADAATDNPDRVDDLIQAARTDTDRQFKERCLRVRAEGRSAEDEAAHARRLHKNRSCRTFTTREGAFGLRAVLTPEAGAPVLAALQAQADRIFEQARRAGDPERPDRYAADALVTLITGQGILPPARRGKTGGGGQTGGQGGGQTGGQRGGAQAPADTDSTHTDTDRDTHTDTDTDTDTATDTATADQRSPSSARPDPRTWVLIRADLDALRRGSVGKGEVCEIPGVGPVPVDHARAVLGDALCHLVITDGVDVTTVCSLGRHIPEALRVAILERDRTCVVPGCHRTLGLEHDHWQVDFAKGGATSLDNLVLLCRHHHRLKTHQGWRLTRQEGAWLFLPPAHPKPQKTTSRKRRRRPPPGPAIPDPPLFHLEE